MQQVYDDNLKSSSEVSLFNLFKMSKNSWWSSSLLNKINKCK